MAEPLKSSPLAPGTSRTPLGKRLLRIREQILALGEPPLTWEEVEREVAGLLPLCDDGEALIGTFHV
jgi:hypothetical protein